MSVKQAWACIEKMKTDEAFREKIIAIETPEERLKAIAAAGFECTAEEINKAVAKYGTGTERRLRLLVLGFEYCRSH